MIPRLKGERNRESGRERERGRELDGFGERERETERFTKPRCGSITLCRPTLGASNPVAEASVEIEKKTKPKKTHH